MVLGDIKSHTQVSYMSSSPFVTSSVQSHPKSSSSDEKAPGGIHLFDTLSLVRQAVEKNVWPRNPRTGQDRGLIRFHNRANLCVVWETICPITILLPGAGRSPARERDE
jgi:hypothetical protein